MLKTTGPKKLFQRSCGVVRRRLRSCAGVSHSVLQRSREKEFPAECCVTGYEVWIGPLIWTITLHRELSVLPIAGLEDAAKGKSVTRPTVYLAAPGMLLVGGFVFIIALVISIFVRTLPIYSVISKHQKVIPHR